MTQPKSTGSHIHVIAFLGGMAALSWEVIWQIKSSLALGISAWGTAVTLAVTIGGMSLGSLMMGRILKGRTLKRPVRLYGTLECLIGFFGLLLKPMFAFIQNLDTWVYAQSAAAAPYTHILSILAVLGLPAICIGTTLPVLGLTAQQFRITLSSLYAFNTLGASAGVLIVAFIMIPWFGVQHTTWIITCLNAAIGLSTWLLGVGEIAIIKTEAIKLPVQKDDDQPARTATIVAVTGFATFALEVCWFRSFTAAFFSTTDAFAIMLAPVLLALGLSARLAPFLKGRGFALGRLLGIAGCLILLVTPLVERLDTAAPYPGNPLVLINNINHFILTAFIIGPPAFFLGIAVPWLLDDRQSPQKWARLYFFNTFSAILGSLGTAWLLLPTIGGVHTEWLVGTLVLITGFFTAAPQKRYVIAGVGALSLLIAVTFESGIGRTHVQGHFVFSSFSKPAKVLEYYEGPAATVAAIEYDNGARVVAVNGFVAAGQYGNDIKYHGHYMPWMGHLPMLQNVAPKHALVICFGSGQTANAVRNENPDTLDIVDLDPSIFKIAHNFTANENVLLDPRVKTTIMDGRAYIRRVSKNYDVITLEPMPPNFAGVNALYDKEFYQAARKRLAPHGVIAQWLPFHLISTYSSTSIARTFQAVFPNAILWIDPPSKTGILIGSTDDEENLETHWPGFARGEGPRPFERDMSQEDVENSVWLDRKGMENYGQYGTIIDDDNQLLAYGEAVYSHYRVEELERDNFDLLKKLTGRSLPGF